MFMERKYQPSMSEQQFFGISVHSTVDRAHELFISKWESNGKNENLIADSVPSSEEIEKIFEEVTNALRNRGLFASENVKQAALKNMIRFNKVAGSELYPRIVHTEFNVEAEVENHILSGCIDVVAESHCSIKDKKRYDEYEIWDYKGSKRPDLIKDLQPHIMQIRAYAFLYCSRTGVLPSRGILYYIGDYAETDKSSEQKNAKYVVDFTKKEIDESMEEIKKIIREIDLSRKNRMWKEPVPINDITCKDCDNRWSCTYANMNDKKHEVP